MTITELVPVEPATATPAPHRGGATTGAVAPRPIGGAGIATAPPHPATGTARGGLELRALAGTAGDRELVADLVRRSSPGSLRSRFFLPGRPDPQDVLRTHLGFLLAGPPDGVALAALVDGRAVGVLNLVPGPGGRLELGVLVADAWQGRGVGGTLLRHALRPGRWPGRTVRASVQPGNAGARALVRSRGGSRLVSGLRGEYVFEFPADPPPC